MKLLIVAGARPNFMKVAPVIKAIRSHNALRQNRDPEIKWRLIHTGQHYDEKMSNIFFNELGIPTPDINLEIGSGSHAFQTANVMTRFEPVCEHEKPEWVVVVGDVNSTMACTLVCSKMGIKVAHVEAGLRSYDRSMPEEVNRVVTDSLADLLLTPSADADENLRKEGVPKDRIKLVGNVMIDTVVANLEKARTRTLLGELGLKQTNFIYVTLHRPSNVDVEATLTAIMSKLKRLSAVMPVVFPMHPRTRKRCVQFGIPLNGCKGFQVINPIGYHDSLLLTEKARLVLTDSGGLQEESTYFRTPCLTLRPNTERPVTITMGSNQLTDATRLSDDLEAALNRGPRYGNVPPFWDGCSANRVIGALLSGMPGSHT